uniref:Transmembrane protein 218 n=1 Tax=Callorhinchus milii TaxID=7868 RepID=V9LG66_CALMI
MGGVVLGVGAGVFILTFVWAVALTLCLLLSRTGSLIRCSVILVFLVALLITVSLVFFPRSSLTPEPVDEVLIIDTFFIGRYLLLCILIVVFLTGLFLIFTHHILEPLQAKPLRAQ